MTTETYCTIHRIKIYLLDSVTPPSNNRYPGGEGQYPFMLLGGEEQYLKVHTATRWTIRHSLMLHWFADLMNVTEEAKIHRPNPKRDSIHSYSWVERDSIHLYSWVKGDGIHSYYWVERDSIYLYSWVERDSIHSHSWVERDSIHLYSWVEGKEGQYRFILMGEETHYKNLSALPKNSTQCPSQALNPTLKINRVSRREDESLRSSSLY